MLRYAKWTSKICCTGENKVTLEPPERQGKRQRQTTQYEESFADRKRNKAGYTTTPVASGWAGPVFEVTGSF